MNIAEANALIEAGTFFKNPEIRAGIWEMLGKGPPWTHNAFQTVSGMSRCDNCQAVRLNAQTLWSQECNPPPLDVAPEVVARQLLLNTDTTNLERAAGTLLNTSSMKTLPPENQSRIIFHWLLNSRIEMQVLACLVAGEKVSENE